MPPSPALSAEWSGDVICPPWPPTWQPPWLVLESGWTQRHCWLYCRKNPGMIQLKINCDLFQSSIQGYCRQLPRPSCETRDIFGRFPPGKGIRLGILLHYKELRESRSELMAGEVRNGLCCQISCIFCLNWTVLKVNSVESKLAARRNWQIVDKATTGWPAVALFGCDCDRIVMMIVIRTVIGL